MIMKDYKYIDLEYNIIFFVGNGGGVILFFFGMFFVDRNLIIFCNFYSLVIEIK